MLPAEAAAVADKIASFKYDPLGFVKYAFDWGHGELEGFDGPDTWQIDLLEDLGKQLRYVDEHGGAVKLAVASGHGVGKTALISWLIIFFMSTCPDVEMIVTANTKLQLETKTWRQLSLWWKRAVNQDWFEKTATKFYAKEAPDTWFAAAIPWSEEKPEAFAGGGDAHSRTILLFDEASSIPDSINEATEGALTRGRVVKVAFGNPTRNTGWFRECWRRFSERWTTQQVDSRTAKMVDQKVVNDWIDDYGDDSDFVRVRVKGEFPRRGTMQFISSETVSDAQERKAEGYDELPRILGVDVARYGDDKTVFARRQGSKLFPLEKQVGWDTMQTGKRVAQIIDDWHPHVCFVDGIGVGAGVVDYLIHTGYDVVDVVASRKPADAKTYVNLRAEMWGGMKSWLETADIPDDDELQQDLTAPEYMFNAKMQIVLEKKEDLKKRSLDSPDCADALAVTFSGPAEVSDFFRETEDDHTEMQGRNAVSGY
jgi:hypothetical protein